MKLPIGILVMLLPFAGSCAAQTIVKSNANHSAPLATLTQPAIESYTVTGATSVQEAALRAQIRLMHPPVLPLRVVFVPHWKYLYTARIFQLHVPAGYGSLMFTHLPSRTIFIDDDRYIGEEWLGHWIAHELGHLQTNSVRENDAERAAREFRRRLRDPRIQDPR